MAVISAMIDHHQVHQVILENIRMLPHVPGDQYPLCELTDAQTLRVVFENYRIFQGQSQGLRLTHYGDQILRQIFDHWQYPHQTRITNGVLLELDKTMIWPYYVARNHMVFYNETDAALFRLSGHTLNSIQ